MAPESSDSGFDELMRLSRETARQQQEISQRENKQAEQRQKVRGVLQGLKEIKVSVAVEQLRSVATDEYIEEVSSLAQKQGTEDLRKLISDLAEDLEKQMDSVTASNPDMVPVERSVKTLAILIDLFFSLQ